MRWRKNIDRREEGERSTNQTQENATHLDFLGVAGPGAEPFLRVPPQELRARHTNQNIRHWHRHWQWHSDSIYTLQYSTVYSTEQVQSEHESGADSGTREDKRGGIESSGGEIDEESSISSQGRLQRDVTGRDGTGQEGTRRDTHTGSVKIKRTNRPGHWEGIGQSAQDRQLSNQTHQFDERARLEAEKRWQLETHVQDLREEKRGTTVMLRVLYDVREKYKIDSASIYYYK